MLTARYIASDLPEELNICRAKVKPTAFPLEKKSSAPVQCLRLGHPESVAASEDASKMHLQCQNSGWPRTNLYCCIVNIPCDMETEGSLWQEGILVLKYKGTQG